MDVVKNSNNNNLSFFYVMWFDVVNINMNDNENWYI